MSTNPRRTLIPKNEVVNERKSSPVRARSPIIKTPMDNTSKAVIQQKSIAVLEAERYAMRQREEKAMHEKQPVKRLSALPTYDEFLADYMYGLYAFEIFRREYTKTGKEKEMHEVPISGNMASTLRINKRCLMCDFDISAEEAGAKPAEMKKQSQLASKDGFSFAGGKGVDSREIKLVDKVFMRIRRLQRFESASTKTPVIEFYEDFLTNIPVSNETTR